MWATTSRISHNSAFGDGGGIYNKTTNTSIGITVRFMKSTLSDNHTDFKNTGGGGLANLGGARFEGSTVSDNVSTFGGGILNWGDLEVVQQSTVSDNQALREGGGVYNGVGMMGDASTIADNTAEESGGGIFSLGDITLTNFTIADNRAVNRDGGGIWNDGSFYENRGDVILTKSVVSGNRAENGFGGGIHSVDGDLDISGSTKEGSSRLYLNRAVWGGAIDNEGGDVTITRTAVTSNRALAGGGGLYNSAGGDAEMVRSVFSRNRADAGGGILNEATLTVDRSTISDNRGSFGGGIQSAGGASITASTLSDNQAEQFGGGVWASNGITIFNSTLSGNTAEYWGGGLFVGAGQATVTWTTFMGNVGGKDALSTLDGGSIYNDSGIAVILSNSILASSRGGNTTSPTFSNCFGPMSVTKTLSDTTCAAASVGDPRLASSLALNLNSSSPYPTWTHALLAATPIMGLACPATDQRGLPHSRTDPCDIGSYEFP
jgi:predicted outer membrane repeat protein